MPLKRNKPIERKPFPRKPNSLRRTSGLSRGTKRLGPGPKTKEWAKVRAELKVEFAAAGITTCEFRFPGCWVNNTLSFAHAVKRDDLDEYAPLGSPENIRTVALACTAVCHDVLDTQMSHAEMRKAVMAAIARREQR